MAKIGTNEVKIDEEGKDENKLRKIEGETLPEAQRTQGIESIT